MSVLNPEALFEDVAQFVAQSRELLQSGAMMELAGLDNRIMLLCEEVLMLSQDQRARYSDQLQQLFNDLSALGQEMGAQRDRIENEMRGLPQHKKATTAYRIAEESDKKEED